MEIARTPVAPEDKYIEIIFATLKACANNRILNATEFFNSVRVLDSFMEQYKDTTFTNAMKKIDGWSAIERHKIGAEGPGLKQEQYHQWFTELAKLIQRSGFTPPVVMDAVITTDDTDETIGDDTNDIPNKNNTDK